jgi:hypothetical protein
MKRRRVAHAPVLKSRTAMVLAATQDRLPADFVIALREVTRPIQSTATAAIGACLDARRLERVRETDLGIF